MGATSSLPDSINIEEIIHNTGLSKKQIHALWERFHELDTDNRTDTKGLKGYLDADDFGRIPKFDENPMAPRLIKVIFDDFGSNGQLKFPQFVNFMSIFSQMELDSQDPSGHHHHHHQRRHSATPIPSPSSKTALELVKFSANDSAKARKVKFMFRMYDIDRDGHLSREDIQETLKMMVGKISDEEASIIAEKVIGEFTEEQLNSTVTLDAFEKTLRTLDFNDKMGLKLLK